jgi:hypothetical protein
MIALARKATRLRRLFGSLLLATALLMFVERRRQLSVVRGPLSIVSCI